MAAKRKSNMPRPIEQSLAERAPGEEAAWARAGGAPEVVYDRVQDRELALGANRRWMMEEEEEDDEDDDEEGPEGYHCQICGYHTDQLQPFNVHLHTAHPTVVLQELYGLLGLSGGLIPGLGLTGGLIPGLTGGPIPGLTGGPIPGLTGGPIPGLTGGPIPGLTGGPIPGLTGPIPSLTGGPIPGLTGGPIPSLTGGPIPGLTGGPIPSLTGGPIPGLTGGPYGSLTGLIPSLGLTGGLIPGLTGGLIPGLGLTGSPIPGLGLTGSPIPGLGLTGSPISGLGLTGVPIPGLRLARGPMPGLGLTGGPLTSLGLGEGEKGKVGKPDIVQIDLTSEDEAGERTPGQEEAVVGPGPVPAPEIKVPEAGVPVVLTSSSSSSSSLKQPGPPAAPGAPRELGPGLEQDTDGPLMAAHRTQAPSQAPAPSPGRPRKTKEQLAILKTFFLRSQWPSGDDYTRLVERTGLARADIIQWFGDTRYALKNGQLKWVHRSPTAFVAGAGPRAVAADCGPLEEYLSQRGRLRQEDLYQLCVETRMSAQQVAEWFRRRARPLDLELEAVVSEEGGSEEDGPEEESGGPSEVKLEHGGHIVRVML
uniref:elastin-like n=1 Tax=Pristiophorus japonicus TaxID=55135 RepID=UPI00398E5F35